MRLVISAAPLIDRWSITAHNRRDLPAWPPSPDTMFSALVASAASQGNACDPSLYWLESLGNPAIEAELDVGGHSRLAYDPVADYHRWDKKSDRKARPHNSIGAGTVSWSWDVDHVPDLPAIERIAEGVTYIGSSRGPVMARAYVTPEPLPKGALVPTMGRATHRIRGLYRGRLDELERAFQGGQRPRPTLEVGYVEHGRERIVSPWERMIPLRADRLALSVRHAVPVAEALRAAIMRNLPDGAPGVLTGHATDGSPIAGEHLAIVPLPRVADRHAKGELYGAGLMIPRGVSDEDYGALVRGLGGFLAGGGRVDVGPIGLKLAMATGDTRKALSHDRFDGFDRRWSSATPVVFDRHPRRSLTAADVVAEMCASAGLPEPARVEVTPHATIPGADAAKRHSIGGRTYLQQRYRAHVSVTFSRPVPGPILLGQGRYFGLGVMLPW